jgi:hypothetical protein
VRQPVAANDGTVRIGEDGKGVARFLREIGGDGRRVDADRDRPDAEPLELRKLFLKTP